MQNNDKICLVFFHRDFREGPIRYPFRSKETFLSVNLINNFNSVIQSYREITMNENQNLQGTAIIAHLTSGSGRNSFNKKDFKNQQEFLSSSITNNFCGLRAVLIARATYKKDEKLALLLKKTRAIYAVKNMAAFINIIF